MAVGDAVNVNLNALTSYQPAAGVTLFVLNTFKANNWATYAGFQNGVVTTAIYQNGISGRTWNRFCITNTDYFYQQVGDIQTGFSSIQIK